LSYVFGKIHALVVILSVLAKDLASNGKARSFASTLRMTGRTDQSRFVSLAILRSFAPGTLSAHGCDDQRLSDCGNFNLRLLREAKLFGKHVVYDQKMISASSY